MSSSFQAEEAAEVAKLEKLQNELQLMLGDIEALEKEEKLLEKQFGGSGRQSGEGESSAPKKFAAAILSSVVDGDDSKFK
ncbi:hypothetical protein AGDE_13281 [Angomonas deanei]|uniref:Uncharacterized protein n=1 Tax=Angomonas deanei TaxID=59799 RepID=A0A7G2C8X9_9TRYP|nr:hypothetical protein AGDE_13281 [Angomonas deanei]CAD2214462.1 hypothetical protein, conserved [Angomonas deanei]|eukprot:EPY22484.1 hypothetical protein AGDE_13281 [Angomonas deanei]